MLLRKPEKKAARKRTTPKAKAKPKELFVVRLYDGFDNQWIDISKPVSKDEADAIWRKETNNGTRKTGYGDIVYYKVFPADTKMLYSDGFGEH